MLRGLRDRTLDVALTVAISPHDSEGLAVENLGERPSSRTTATKAEQSVAV